MNNRSGNYANRCCIGSFCTIFPLLLCLIILPAQTSQAVPPGWTSYGPEGAFRSVLTVDPVNPSIIYLAAAVGGAYKSIDGGTSWVSINTGLTTLNLNCITVNPSNNYILIAGTAYGIFRSQNGGVSWYQVSATASKTIVFDPADSSIIYASQQKSTDGGATWNTYNVSYSTESYSYAFQPLTHKILAGTSSGLFVSSDNGATWVRTSYVNAESIIVDKHNSAIIYMASSLSSYHGIYKSTDNGDTWTQLVSADLPSNGYNVRSIAIDPDNSATIYAAAYSHGQGLYKSTNSGTNWTKVSSGNGAAYIVALTPSARVFTSIDYLGVFSSDNGGTTWDERNSGLTASRIYSLAAKTGINAGIYTAGQKFGVAKSTTGGESWARVNSGLPTYPQDYYGGTYAVAAGTGVSPNMYAGCTSIYRSPDGGATWTPFDTTGLPTLPVYSYFLAIAVDPLTPTTLFAYVPPSTTGTGRGLYRYTAAGAKWEMVNSITTSSNPPKYFIKFQPGSSQVIYAAMPSPLMLTKSTNGGTSWTNNILYSQNATGLAFDPINPSILYATVQGGESGLYKSTDGGNSWTYPPASVCGTTYLTAVAVDPTNGSRIYVGSNSGICRSIDGGATWQPFGLTYYDIQDILIDPSNPNLLYAATTNQGVFVRNIGTELVPTIDSVSPNSGSDAGGQTVTISGSGFIPFETSVSFGGAAATNIQVLSSTTLTTVTPAHTAGVVDVVVANLTGSSEPYAGGYTYTGTNRSLQVTVTGTGSGSVNSIPSGLIACTWPPLEGTCLTSQPSNTALSLIASPGGDSTFGGWGGDCNACVDLACGVTLDSDKSCTATMTILPLIKIGSSYYASLSKAYSGLPGDTPATMMMQAVEFDETVKFDQNIPLTLLGGYDADFIANNGYTTIHSPLTVQQGSLTVNRLVVKQ